MEVYPESWNHLDAKINEDLRFIWVNLGCFKIFILACGPNVQKSISNEISSILVLKDPIYICAILAFIQVLITLNIISSYY